MNLLTWKVCWALVTECINTKPVTCRKGRKVPFAVTCHKWSTYAPIVSHVTQFSNGYNNTQLSPYLYRIFHPSTPLSHCHLFGVTHEPCTHLLTHTAPQISNGYNNTQLSSLPLSHLSPVHPLSHWHLFGATHVPCEHPLSHTAAEKNNENKRERALNCVFFQCC